MLSLIIICAVGLSCYAWGWLGRDRRAEAREAELTVQLRTMAATQRLHQQAWAVRHQLANIIRDEQS